MKKMRTLFLAGAALAVTAIFTLTPVRIHAAAAQETVMETLLGTESEPAGTESEPAGTESEAPETESLTASESELPESESETPGTESEMPGSESETPESESETPGSETDATESQTESGEVTADPAKRVDTEKLSGLVKKAESLDGTDYSEASYSDTGFPALTGAARDLLESCKDAAYTEETQQQVNLAARTLAAAISQLEAAPESTEAPAEASETEPAQTTETAQPETASSQTPDSETAGTETKASETTGTETTSEDVRSEAGGTENAGTAATAPDPSASQTAADQSQTPDTSDPSDVHNKVLLMILSLMLALGLRRVIYLK